MDKLDEGFFEVKQAAVSPLNALDAEGGYLFVFKVSGELEVSSRDVTRVLNAGQAAIFSLDREYSFTDTGNTSYFAVSGRMTAYFMDMYGIFVPLTIQLSEAAEDFFAICRSTDAREQIYILHGLLRKFSASLEAQTRQKTDTARLIRDYIDANAGCKLTLDVISDVFFLSKSQIFRVFKKRYGIPPMQYYIQKKAEKAMQMLRCTDMRVSDIADALGFSDAKHLSSAFFAHYGVLPRNFRKATKAKKSENI